jgi:sterol desaturase/sphingolipid hydroxylase (fatty acid hydroxylase superfamily)
VIEFLQQATEVWWALAIFAIALPVEYLFATGPRPAVSERLGNVAALFVNFVFGSLLLNALLSWPPAAELMNFPEEPRVAALANPVLYCLAAMFVVDALYYVYHRLQHSVPWLWRIHALHHTDPSVNITTSRRTHFLERPLQFLVLITPSLWLLGWNDRGVALMAVTGPAVLYFSHLDVRLSLGALTPVLVGPQYHRIHHALDAHEHGANFAQAFPIFDVIGGTYRAPARNEFVKTGVRECATPAARWRPILW